MQLERTRLSREERQQRQQEGQCFYCEEKGHLAVVCPARRSIRVSNSKTSRPASRSLTNVMVIHHAVPTEIRAFIDSGADESFMDWGLAKRLGLRTERLERTIKAQDLNGNYLFTITHGTEPVELHLQDNQEIMTFFLFDSSSHALILGLPWLLCYNPHIDWRSGEIMGWERTVRVVVLTREG